MSRIFWKKKKEIYVNWLEFYFIFFVDCIIEFCILIILFLFYCMWYIFINILSVGGKNICECFLLFNYIEFVGFFIIKF